MCACITQRRTNLFYFHYVVRVFQTWQEKEAGKVVLYTTTMGIVRDTYQRCLQVRQILRTHLVKFVERDVFMSREVQKEITERLGVDTISVPQLFVEGNLIGVSFNGFILFISFYQLRIICLPNT